MSLPFSDLTNFKGIIQIYEKECGFNQGDISSNTAKLKAATADVNLAVDDFFTIGFKNSGTWQLDDSNHDDYPIIQTNIISGQRDYSFIEDVQGNLILDIYRVMVADSAGVFREVFAKDQQTIYSDTSNYIDGQNSTGIPTTYDKTANGIFLDLIPNYNRTSGLKVYINREGSYFAYDDTTKMPGVPGSFHKYFALKPALDYARRKSLANYNALAIEVAKMEKEIADLFGRRERDIVRRLVPAKN